MHAYPRFETDQRFRVWFSCRSQDLCLPRVQFFSWNFARQNLLSSRGLQTLILKMRHGKKLRTNGSAKNAAQLTARRRQARKRNAAPRTPNSPKIIEFTASKTDLPVVKAPPSQTVSPLPFLFWPAFPIAMMRMWLGPRNTGVRK